MSEGGDFRVAGAYVELYLKDTTEADWRRIQRELASKSAIGIAAKLDTPDTTKARDQTQAKLDANPLKVAAKVNTPDNITSTRDKAQAEFDAKPVKIPAKVDDKGVKSSAASAGKEGGSILTTTLLGFLDAAAPAAGGALLAGVGTGIVGVAALAQKSNADVADSYKRLASDASSELTSVTSVMAPEFQQAADRIDATAQRVAPTLAQIFKAASPDVAIITAGVDTFANRTLPGLETAARNSQAPMRGLATLAGDVGGAFTNLVDGFAPHGQVIEQVLGKVGGTVDTLTATVGHLASDALPSLAAGAGGTLGTLDSMLRSLQPISPELGAIAGNVLPVVGDFKLFSFVSTPINKAGDALSGLSGKITGTSLASRAASGTVGALGGSLSLLGSAAPVVGTAFAVADTILQHFGATSQQLGQELLAGGSDAQTASNKISGIIPILRSAQSGMTAVQRAQSDVNFAVATFGAKSPQATAAMRFYRIASQDAATSQDRLAQAAQTAGQRLADETTALLGAVNASLAYKGDTISSQQALLSYNQAVSQSKTDAEAAAKAHTAYDAAVAKHGATSKAAKAALATYDAAVEQSRSSSLAAQQASVSYQQALTKQVEAAGKAATANDKGASKARQATDAANAEAATILSLALAAGKNAPPALQQMVNGLSDAQLSALSSTRAIAGTHEEILRLPNGKTVTLRVDSNGNVVIPGLKSQIASVNGKTVPLNVIAQTSGASSAMETLIRRFNGRTITLRANATEGTISLGRALGGIDLPSTRPVRFASGGIAAATPMSSSIATVVPPNVPRIIGDNPSVPEAFAPLDGSQRTRDILTAAIRHEGLSSGPRTVVNNTYNITQLPQEDGSVLAKRVSAETSWSLMTTVGG